LRAQAESQVEGRSTVAAYGWRACWPMLLMFAAHLAAAQQGTHVAPSGKTTIDLRSGTSKIQATFSTHEVQNGTASSPVTPKHLPCTMSRIPCSVVDAVNMKVDGKALFVPRSVFCDLADVNTASLRTAGKGWVLTLIGGDASEAYELTIEFDAERVSRRTLTAGESGQKLQETNYYEVVD
jgi:hypothetical protein